MAKLAENGILFPGDGTLTGPAAKEWIEHAASVLLRDVGTQPLVRIYAYRHDAVGYLALDWDASPESGTPAHWVSMTFAVYPRATKPVLEKPDEYDFSSNPVVVLDWVDALSLANMLCHRVDARVQFNDVMIKG